MTPIAEGLTRVELCFGFMEQPDVPKALSRDGARQIAMRSRAGDLLHRTRDHHPVGPAAGDGALAREAVRIHAP